MKRAEPLTYFLWSGTLLWITLADPTNLIQNGDFSIQSFTFNGFNPVMDVISTGINTLVPYWVTTDGGVQMLDTKVYKTSQFFNATMLLHLNYKEGPGRMVSMPMYTLREGALYSVSCQLADNPDGGPIYKTMRLEITDIFGKRLGPKLDPFVVSNHSTERNNILWQTVSLNVRGTGKPAFLTVDSNTLGSYGPLTSNFRVSLSNIVDNPSFEVFDDSLKLDATYFPVLGAPSTQITNWKVEVGALKIAYASRYQASTDNTAYMLDLNAHDQSATISTTFAIKPSTQHVLLFDSAINPEQQIPITGQLAVVVQGIPSAEFLLTKQVDMDSSGFSIDSIGWNTYEFPFTTGKDDIKCKVTFQSKLPGSFGPLLDNVCVYEYLKNSIKDANETISSVPATVAASSFFTNIQNKSPPNSPPPRCRILLRVFVNLLTLGLMLQVQ
uniref:DUF642 domain-containing protein n=1 Tax=Physcomitrium patens TaxID=3218 RepID=A0A2K1JQC5_PHYPA|nr:hypothetical protein PHYPA_015997 [Physcomitrium patens]